MKRINLDRIYDLPLGTFADCAGLNHLTLWYYVCHLAIEQVVQISSSGSPRTLSLGDGQSLSRNFLLGTNTCVRAAFPDIFNIPNTCYTRVPAALPCCLSGKSHHLLQQLQ